MTSSYLAIPWKAWRELWVSKQDALLTLHFVDMPVKRRSKTPL